MGVVSMRKCGFGPEATTGEGRPTFHRPLHFRTLPPFGGPSRLGRRCGGPRCSEAKVAGTIGAGRRVILQRVARSELVVLTRRALVGICGGCVGGFSASFVARAPRPAAAASPVAPGACGALGSLRGGLRAARDTCRSCPGRTPVRCRRRGRPAHFGRAAVMPLGCAGQRPVAMRTA